MATTQTISGFEVIGWLPAQPQLGTTQLQLNTAAIWLAFSFVASVNKTINDVWLFESGKSGSPIGSNATCELYSDTSAGIPNASIDGPHASDLGASALPASGWLHFGSFTTSLTRGARYWLIFKNANGTPAANNFTYNFSGSDAIPGYRTVGLQSTTQGWGWGKLHTTNSGSSWTANLGGAQGPFVGFSDGSFDGLAYQSGLAVTAANGVYTNREGGVRFTSHANVRLNVRGVVFSPFIVGTPTGNLRYRIYTGASPTGVAAATTDVIPVGNMQGGVNAYFPAYFASTLTIEPGTEVRVVISETTQSDASSNRYGWQEATIKDDANARLVLPFAGTLQKTYTTDASGSSVTWTDTNTIIIPFGLILDTDTPFAAQSTGGLLINPGLSGGLR